MSATPPGGGCDHGDPRTFGYATLLKGMTLFVLRECLKCGNREKTIARFMETSSPRASGCVRSPCDVEVREGKRVVAKDVLDLNEPEHRLRIEADLDAGWTVTLLPKIVMQKVVKSRGAFRDGRVHVLSEECATCIFRPGNLMHLQPGRVAQMTREALAKDSAIICHSTLDGEKAVCRGFFNRHARDTLALRAAVAFDRVTYDTPPPNEEETLRRRERAAEAVRESNKRRARKP